VKMCWLGRVIAYIRLSYINLGVWLDNDFQGETEVWKHYFPVPAVET
jgi:hypothetical protein